MKMKAVRGPQSNERSGAGAKFVKTSLANAANLGFEIIAANHANSIFETEQEGGGAFAHLARVVYDMWT